MKNTLMMIVSEIKTPIYTSVNCFLGKGAKKKKLKKKLTSVSFMYVCVAENGEMLVLFSFFFLTIV